MQKILGIDKRALMLFRQCIALLYLYTGVIYRFQYFELFSVEKGPFTNKAMETIQNPPFLLHIIHTDFQLILLLCFSALVGVLLFFGIFPSLSSFVALFLYSSLARRFFPYFLGTDEVIVCALFVLGFVFLIPSNTSKNKTISINSNPFLFVLLVQVTIIYFFNGINKTDSSWWNGEAVRMTIFNPFFNKPFALNFFNQVFLCKFLTHFTHLFELLFPLLIFSVYKPSFFRIVAAIGLSVFHWGIDIFADVTFYKYSGIAFSILLLPTSFWDKFPFLNKLCINNKYQMPIKMPFNFKIITIFAYLLAFFLLFKAVNASIFRQNSRYKFIKNEKMIGLMDAMCSMSYNPLRQYWFMFAPSPPKESGYIGFDYVKNGKIENINIYKNTMPNKPFSKYHPFHLCILIQYTFIAKGVMPAENQFILFNFMDYYVQKDMLLHKDRKQEDYELAIYVQSYADFKQTQQYHFERKVLASYH